jgi:putative tryptophan/tyrosine transport system substrate-binding protein
MRVRRREFIAGLGAAAWPLAARAQQPAMPTIGWLHAESPNALQHGLLLAFQRGLAETGFYEGLNLAVEYRWAEGHYDRLPALAADLIRRQVGVIVTPGSTPAALAAKAATQTVPVVFAIGGDPVELGLVVSFNRPGGNLTGTAVLGAKTVAKRLALLHQFVPAELIAMFVNPANPYAQAETKDLVSAAVDLGVGVLVLDARAENEIAASFAKIVEKCAGALLISADIFFNGASDQIISLAARHAMPKMYFYSSSVSAGGLFSYGTDVTDAFRQDGVYAGRILKGEKPADLPVVQPTKFELVINLKTAKALGLDVPAKLLALADAVIE